MRTGRNENLKGYCEICIKQGVEREEAFYFNLPVHTVMKHNEHYTSEQDKMRKWAREHPIQP